MSSNNVKSEYKNTYFFMILARLCRFNYIKTLYNGCTTMFLLKDDIMCDFLRRIVVLIRNWIKILLYRQSYSEMIFYIKGPCS